MIFKQEQIKSWFTGINNDVVQPFQNAEQVIWKYNQAIQHNSLTQQGWQRLLAQSDDSLKAYLTSIKGSTATMSGYNVSLQGNIVGFSKITKAMQQYNALGATSLQEQQAFAGAVGITNTKLGSYLSGLNGAKASLAGYGLSLVTSTAKTVGLTVATTALNATLTMGISLIISGLISAFTSWIHKSEEITEKAQEATDKINSISDSLKENTKTVENAKKRYAELAQEVENLGKTSQSKGSLSNEEYEEFLNLSNQLASVFPSLTKNYDENGNAILNLSGDVNTIIDSLDNLIQKEKELTNQEIMKEFPDKFAGFAKDLSNAEQNVKSAKAEFDKINNAYRNLNNGSSIQMGFNKVNINEDSDERKTEIGNYISWLEDLGLDYEESIISDTYGAKIGTLVTAIGDIDTAFTSKLEDAREELKYAQQKLEGQASSINQYLNTWLQTEFSYNQIEDSGLQAAIQDMLFNFDWNSLPEKVDKKDWNAVSEYFRRNILFAINDVQDNKEISTALSEIFSNAELTPNEKTNYLKQVQDYFGEDNIVTISLKTQIDDAETLQKQYQNAIDFTEDKFKGYNATNFFTNNSINTQEEIDKWLEIAQAANSAAEAEKQYLSSDVSSSLLSLPVAIKKVNGFKEGDTEVIGLIEEYQLLQEVLSDTGNIQEETYKKLLSCSSKYSTAIRTENGRITVNTSKLKAVAKSRQLDTKEAIRQTLALKKQEWVQWNQGIENYNGALLENIKTTYGDIDALQSQITQYELLANSVDNASSAFENFKNAQSTEDQDMYNTAQDAFDVLKGYSNDPENENFGKYNRDEFQEAAMLLMDNSTYKKALNAKDLEEYQKIVDNFVKSVEPLFDEKNYNSAANLFDRINEIIESGDVPEADIDWANRLGISKEMFHALSQFGNQYDFNHKEIFEGYQLNTLDEYQSLLSNVKTAQEALNECTDKTSNEYSYLSMQLDEAKRKYGEFKNETADTLEDAYADYIHSGAKSKGDFAEYLKKNLNFDDSDITGSIDVLLDKSKSLQENLENMHPDSAAYELYKKQLDDINTLLGSLDFDIDPIDKTRSLEDKISQYKELVKEAEGYKKTLETADEGSDAYKEAAQELERISGLMNELRDPLRLEINSNISEIDSQISQLDEKLNGLKESLKRASGSKEAYAIHMDIKGVENEKAKLEGQKKELQETVKFIVDSTEVDEYDPEEKESVVKYSPDFTEVMNEEVPKLKGTIEYDAKMPNQPATPASAASSGKANGTFNAFAQGTGSNVSIKKDEKALVNELGEEGVVRNGKLIPIKGGAQFIKLKRGDIVFNHKQMEQLRKNGYATGRGKLIGAHADGTINAYAGTGNGYRINMPNLKDVMENNRAIQQAKNESKKAVEEEAKEAAEQVKEASEEVFDWIEKRIESFKRKFDKWIKQAETAVTSGFVTKYYKKATNAIKKELSAYGKAYGRYMKEANAVGLDKKYRDKVKNGTIDIETIQDEELAEKIQKYQEWYNYYAPLSGNRCRHSI